MIRGLAAGLTQFKRRVTSRKFDHYVFHSVSFNRKFDSAFELPRFALAAQEIYAMIERRYLALFRPGLRNLRVPLRLGKQRILHLWKIPGYTPHSSLPQASFLDMAAQVRTATEHDLWSRPILRNRYSRQLACRRRDLLTDS